MVLVGILALTFSVGLTACDSGGGKKAVKVTPPATPAPPTSRPATVDLTISSDVPYLAMPVKGTQGTCYFREGGLAPSYVLDAFQYPQLGAGGGIKVYGTTLVADGRTVPPNVKAFVKGIGLLSSASGRGVTISSDAHTVQLDADLTGGVGGSAATSVDDPTDTLKIHIAGSIRCT